MARAPRCGDPRRPPVQQWGGVLPAGGLVEPGESPVEAAVREVAEEVGHVVDPSHLTLAVTLEAEAYGRVGTRMTYRVFTGGPLPSTLTRQADEVSQIVWLPASRWVAFAPAVRLAIEQIDL